MPYHHYDMQFLLKTDIFFKDVCDRNIKVGKIENEKKEAIKTLV